MIKKLVLDRLSADNKRLLNNFFSLSVVQGLNYLFPLITFPYLIRVLGAEKYGLIAFAASVITYFQIVTDYGFNLSATRDISINRNDESKVSCIFSTVMIIKTGLLLVSFIILNVIVMSFDKFKFDYMVYFITFLGLIGNTLFPVWFFQGMEKMKYITYLNFLSRIFSTILIFVIIKRENDYLRFVMLNSLTMILIGIVSFCFVIRKFKVKLYKPEFKVLKEQIIEGWYIFVSNFSVNIYMSSNTLILGIFTNNTIVGYYSMVDKIITAVRNLASVIFLAIYPHICKLAYESRERFISFYRKMIIVVTVCFLPGCLVLCLFSGSIILLLSGKVILQSSNILKILSFVPFIVVLNVPAYQTLLAYNLKKSYTSLMLSGSIINILLNLVLAYKFSSYGTAVSVLLTELYITTGLYLVIEIKHGKYSLFRRTRAIEE